MFERMEISESIYEVVVEPSYKKSTREDTNHAFLGSKIRVEAASATTYYNMRESAGNCR